MESIRFKNLPIIFKMILLVLVSFVPIILIIFFSILPAVEEKYYEDKNEQIKIVVETAYGIIKNYNQRYLSQELSLEDAQNRAIDDINSLRYSGNEYFFVYDLDGITKALGSDPKKKGENRINIVDKLGNYFVKDMIRIAQTKGEGFVDYFYPKLGEETPSPKRSYVKVFREWNWFIGSGVYIDDVEEDISNFKSNLLLPIIIAISIAVVFGLFISFMISKPIKVLESNAEKFIGGNYDIKIAIDNKDEIGKLAQTFNKMIDYINSYIADIKQKTAIAEQAASEAEASKQKSIKEQEYLESKVEEILREMVKFKEGVLDLNLRAEKNDAIGRLFNGFNDAVVNVKNMIMDVSSAVEAVASASAEITSSAEEMAAGAQEQSNQVREITHSIDEMTKTIIQNSTVALKASDAAGIAKGKAQNGGTIVNETTEGMNRIADVVTDSAKTVENLGKGSQQIGEIIQVIDDIADQTNLLALNAAIEAARAGEQGRGFAVVADEVRKLAEKTTHATKEIAQMIRSIQSDTQMAVESISRGAEHVKTGKDLSQKAAMSLTEIINETDKVTEMVSSVAAASEEQSSTSEEISKRVETISTVTQESATATQEIARASEDLNRLTIRLQELISQFKFERQYHSHNTTVKRTKLLR